MIGAEDILNAINSKLVGAFPERTVYIDRVSQKFERPSFLIGFVTTDMTDKSMSAVEMTYYFILVCYEAKDKDYNSDTLQLIRTQEAILNLFRCGKLKVKDRSINVQASASGKDEDVFYIDLQMTFMDNRGLIDEEYDLIQDIHTKFKEG